MKIKSTFLIFLFSFSFLLLVNCSSPTETHKGNLKGTVALENETDHSGITVSLYDLAYLDTTIVRINNQYPQIGVMINQHTEFDHRLQSPIMQTTTDAEGNFELQKLPKGTYNFVAIKAGYGFKYLYEIEINNGDNELGQEVTLYEANQLSGTITEDWIFQTDHHYIIEDDTEFVPGTFLEIQPGAIVRINPGKDLTIHSNFKAQGEENNMFWITTNDGFDNYEFLMFNSKLEENSEPKNNSKLIIQNLKLIGDSLALYNSMQLSSIASVEDDLIEWGKWDWSSIALEIEQEDNLDIKNSIFQGVTSGLHLKNNIDNTVSHIISKNSDNDSNGGIYFLGSNQELSQNNHINNCILLNNSIGIHFNRTKNSRIFNNYITDCNFGIMNQFFATDNYIENNDVLNNDISIENAANSTIYIYYNNIYSNVGVNNTNRDQYGVSYSYINHNNLICIEYSVRVTGRLFLNQPHIDAKNNWWGTGEESVINNLIWDRNDVDPNDPEFNSYGIVDYIPFENQSIQEAGIPMRGRSR